MGEQRLIDANALYEKHRKRFGCKSFMISHADIFDAPTITLPERGWKFFDDEKPENDDDIILCFRERFPFDKEWKYQVCEAYVSEYEGYLYDEKHHLYFNTYNDWDEGQVIEYIAWMPMPEPPKMEDEA